MERNLLILGASSDLATALIPEIAGNYDTIYTHYHSSAEKILKLKDVVPCRIAPLKADFTSEEETTRLLEQVADDGKDITHILHCPSAKVENKRFQKTKWEEYSLMLDIQLRSFYFFTNRFVPLMAKRRYGKVVTILSSVSVGSPPAFKSAYVTAKYALLGLVRSLAAEYASKSVQINAVSPSMIETKFLEDMPHLLIDQNAADHPLGRNAKTEDIVPVIKFLLSDESGFVTGQNLLVSGGSIIC